MLLAATLMGLPTPAHAKHSVALADDASSILTNPAGLLWLNKRTILLDVTTLGQSNSSSLLPAASSSFFGSSVDRLIAYAEPDSGLGAGAMSVYGSPDFTQYMYSLARRIGPATAAGANIKYRTSSVANFWSLDLGLRHDLRDEISLGLSVLNALSSRGKASVNSTIDPLPTGAHMGVAFKNPQGFFVAADYTLDDLNKSDDAIFTIVAGVDLDKAVIWGGQRSIGPDWKHTYVLGLEINFGTLTFNSTIFDVAGTIHRTYSFGIAYLF